MAAPRITIDELPEATVVSDTDLAVIQSGDTTKRVLIPNLVGPATTLITDHIADTSDAHDATAISATTAGGPLDGPTVQAQLNQASALFASAVGTDEVWIGADAPSDPAIELWYDTDAPDPGGGGGGGASEMFGTTVDTGESYRVIVFSDGTCRAIPISAIAPDIPSLFARVVRVAWVKMTWNVANEATSYIIHRDGVAHATTTTNSYRDAAITVGQTYEYTVQSVSAYGLRSAQTLPLVAYIDPALNIAPTVEVRSWPATVPAGQRAVIRVNAIDADAQVLALTLGVDVGSLVATADPTVWNMIP
jgi:hypothetical protein